MQFLWKEEQHADLRILFDDREVPGHIVVLAWASPVWRQRFFGPVHACQKDASIVDMRGHDDLFMEMVYGYDIDEEEEENMMIAYSILMDAIELAHRYDVDRVRCNLRRYIEFNMNVCPVNFVKNWSHWNNDDICNYYESVIRRSLEELLERGKKLPREAQWYIIDHSELFEFGSKRPRKIFLDILIERWDDEKEDNAPRNRILSELDTLCMSHFVCVEMNAIVESMHEKEPDEFFYKIESNMAEHTLKFHTPCPAVRMLCKQYAGRKRTRECLDDI